MVWFVVDVGDGVELVVVVEHVHVIVVVDAVRGGVFGM